MLEGLGGSRRVLVVLFVPSVERDGTTEINQDTWVEAALAMFGSAFGGATDEYLAIQDYAEEAP